MLFALIQEHDPPQWSHLPLLLRLWVQSAGGVAGVALLLFTLASLGRSAQSAEKRVDVSALLLGLALLFPPMALLLWLLLTMRGRWLPSEKALQLPFLYFGTALTLTLYEAGWLIRTIAGGNRGEALLALAGLCAVAMVLAPVVAAAVTRMRIGRIWALARLSLKEAMRNRVVFVFAIMALVFLFADWFVPYKAENQVRNYVRVVYWSMTPLFLLTATLLGAFSLPTDIKNQSIHTIVTKPVERLEIVLGRFLGYGIVLTVGLAVVGAVSYLYLQRGVTPEAAEESFKARVPLYGNLYFFDPKKPAARSHRGESVGREWGYRSYIAGPPAQNLTAPKAFMVWEFDDLPSDLGEDTQVPIEFTLDIFRLNKGQENQHVFCEFTFADGRINVENLEAIREKLKSDRNKRQNEASSKQGSLSQQAKDAIEEQLLQDYGLYEISVGVKDYHTQKKEVPASLFRRLRKLDLEKPRTGEPGARPPQMIVAINIQSRSHSQLVGAARRDVYLLADEQPFWQNFFKGIIGMWFTYLLVLGVAVACSTYLSGVISWLCTLFLFGAGTFNEYIQQLADNRSIGGGPFESLRKLALRQPITAPPDPTPVSTLVSGADDFYRGWLKLFLHIIPDVNRFDLHHYVANGFDISWGPVLFLDNFLYLAGYLLLWGVLAFYLMRFREIANPT